MIGSGDLEGDYGETPSKNLLISRQATGTYIDIMGKNTKQTRASAWQQWSKVNDLCLSQDKRNSSKVFIRKKV
jgi:hypothetical protein